MITYHNDPKIKAHYLSRVIAHRKADQLIQGYGYWKAGKGCAVGCTIHGGDHAAYETELGIPRLIARLEDGIFEGLPAEEAKQWPENFLDAVPVGVDLDPVFPKFMTWLLIDPTDGVLRFARTDKVKLAILNIGEAFLRVAAGESVGIETWRLLRTAAAYAAYAASAASVAASADAYAASAAYAASVAASAAAASAYAASVAASAAAASAYAAAYAYAASAADAASRWTARIKQSNKLIELLKAA